MKKINCLILATVLLSCGHPVIDATFIIDQAIKISGTEKLKNAEASFIFRDVSYSYQHRNGQFRYIRTQTDSLGNEIKDVLINAGLNRFVNGKMIDLDSKDKASYTSSVNSVMYFAFLPLWLDDPAVNKEYMNEVEIKGRKYHKVKVTFNPEGGGEDFEDVFIYWFDCEDYSMDYLAYSYNEEDGKGIRFREAYHARSISGVRIQDFRNYTPKNGFMDLDQLDRAFDSDELELLSTIELTHVSISN